MRCRACVHPSAEPVLPMTALKWKVFTSTSLAERKSKMLTASWCGSKCLRDSIWLNPQSVLPGAVPMLNVFYFSEFKPSKCYHDFCILVLTFPYRRKPEDSEMPNQITNPWYGLYRRFVVPAALIYKKYFKTFLSWSCSRATFFKNLVANCGLLEKSERI